jgi:hypothetical protein
MRSLHELRSKRNNKVMQIICAILYRGAVRIASYRGRGLQVARQAHDRRDL